MSNKVQGYRINVQERTVTPVWHDTLQDIYAHLSADDGAFECDVFTVAPLGNGESIYVDDNGLLKITPDTLFFMHEAYPQPMAGNGLYVGPVNGVGETLYPKTPIEDVRKAIRFMNLAEVQEWASKNG